MTLSEMIDKILEDTSASTGVPRTDMDHSLLFAACHVEDCVTALEKKVKELEGQNSSLEKDARDKITTLMKNQEILTHDCQKMAGLLDIERTKVAYLGKLAEVHRRKIPDLDNEEWGIACASAAALLSKVYVDEKTTVANLKEVIKTAGTILGGGVPEATTALGGNE